LGCRKFNSIHFYKFIKNALFDITKVKYSLNWKDFENFNFLIKKTNLNTEYMNDKVLFNKKDQTLMKQMLNIVIYW
jgi:LPS O-antigen subunit length determinant protein (WzzB/FepE family)